MKQLGQASWFSLGDLDLATHLTRTMLLRAGKRLSEATPSWRKVWDSCPGAPYVGRSRFYNARHRKGTLTFQEYFVRERHQVEARAVRFEGAENARPAPGVIESIETAEAIVFARVIR